MQSTNKNDQAAETKSPSLRNEGGKACKLLKERRFVDFFPPVIVYPPLKPHSCSGLNSLRSETLWS